MRDLNDPWHGRHCPEDAQHLMTLVRGCGRQDSGGPVLPFVLADRLTLWPIILYRPERPKVKVFEGALCGKVGDVRSINVEAPDVTGEPMCGRDPILGRGTKPLGPGGLFAAREVEAPDDRAALPTRIEWVLAPEQRR